MLLLALAACLSGSETPSAPPAAPAPVAAKPPPTAPAAPTGTPLAALVSTSASAWRLMDGDVKTEWKPHGHKANEGILLRFEEPTAIEGVKLHPCGSGPVEMEGFADGATVGRVRFGAEAGELVVQHTVRSVFLRVLQWDEAACLGEIEVTGADVRGPRFVPASFTASSTLEPVAAYRPDQLFDSRLDFGWVEGADGLGIGETVGVTWKEPIPVTAVELWNGYQRSEDHFEKNARAARIALILGEERVEFDVKDAMGSQVLTLPSPVETTSLTVEILAAEEGSTYPDLVLSELRIHDAEGPRSFASVQYKKQAFGTLNRARGTAVERLVDYSLVSHCAPEARQLKLRSNSSFVYYARDPEGADEVFDGAWVIEKPQGAGTRLQLFGRRHRTERDWSPYGGADETVTTRVAGGKPVFTRVTAIDEATFRTLTDQIRKAEGRDCAYDYAELKEKDAVLAIGTSFMDAFVLDPSRG